MKTKLDAYGKWMKERFLVMEYSFDVHDKLRRLFKQDMADKELIEIYKKETKNLFSNDPEPLSRRNAAYYIWGHLKNRVTRKEKKRIFSIMENLDGDPESYIDVKKEFYILALKYDVRALLASSYFDQIRTDS